MMKANAETDESEVLSIAGHRVEILPPSKLISSYAAQVHVVYPDGGEWYFHTGIGADAEGALIDLLRELEVVHRVCTRVMRCREVGQGTTVAGVRGLMDGILANLGDD